MPTHLKDEQPTEHYRRLAGYPEQMQEWTSEELLLHFLETRLMIQTDSGMRTNDLRMGYVFQVGRYEHEEILRRMNDSVVVADYSETPSDLSQVLHFLRNIMVPDDLLPAIERLGGQSIASYSDPVDRVKRFEEGTIDTSKWHPTIAPDLNQLADHFRYGMYSFLAQGDRAEMIRSAAAHVQRMDQDCQNELEAHWNRQRAKLASWDL